MEEYSSGSSPGVSGILLDIPDNSFYYNRVTDVMLFKII